MIRFSNYNNKALIHMRLVLVSALIQFFIPPVYSQDTDNSVEMGSLIVRITGFASDDGDCWFALDNSKEVYESEYSVFIGKILPIINNEVLLKIDSLKYGSYAIKVFHDENRNEELDSNLLGIPTEDYGYSNNASAWFGPPSWEKAKFLLNEREMTIEISVD
ncbi:DUF2141 domain-containing protein [Bacteroidota bacterium]